VRNHKLACFPASPRTVTCSLGRPPRQLPFTSFFLLRASGTLKPLRHHPCLPRSNREYEPAEDLRAEGSHAPSRTQGGAHQSHGSHPPLPGSAPNPPAGLPRLCESQTHLGVWQARRTLPRALAAGFGLDVGDGNQGLEIDVRLTRLASGSTKGRAWPPPANRGTASAPARQSASLSEHVPLRMAAVRATQPIRTTSLHKTRCLNQVSQSPSRRLVSDAANALRVCAQPAVVRPGRSCAVQNECQRRNPGYAVTARDFPLRGKAISRTRDHANPT
jgi:hypothetical protein